MVRIKASEKCKTIGVTIFVVTILISSPHTLGKIEGREEEKQNGGTSIFLVVFRSKFKQELNKLWRQVAFALLYNLKINPI